MEQLYGNAYEVEEFEEGMELPVTFGIFAKHESASLRLDTSNVNGLLEKMQEAEEELREKNPRLEEKLTESDIDIPPSLFASAFAFQNTYDDEIGFDIDMSARRDMYSSGATVPLSEALETAPACTELSALAKLYLEAQGFEVTFFNGQFLGNEQQEHPESHTFNPVYDWEAPMIYDPGRPHEKTSQNEEHVLSPKIGAAHGFPSALLENQQSFVKVRDLTENTTSWYGAGRGVNVTEKQLLHPE